MTRCLDFGLNLLLHNSLLPVFYYSNEVSITADHPSVKIFKESAHM